MAGILTERLMNHRPLLLPLALLVPLALAACNKPAEPAADPAATSMADPTRSLCTAGKPVPALISLQTASRNSSGLSG